jgi:predicted GNAT family acetyltransferase
METRVVDDRAAGRFEILVDGARGGHATYRRTDSTVSLTHTEIDPAYEGKGLGSVLARGALDAIRAEGLSVLPLCPFIRGYIERHPKYVDLVPAQQRERFDLPAGTP